MHYKMISHLLVLTKWIDLCHQLVMSGAIVFEWVIRTHICVSKHFKTTFFIILIYIILINNIYTKNSTKTQNYKALTCSRNTTFCFYCLYIFISF